MPINPTAIAAVQAKLKPAAAMILQVDWSDSITKYYADRVYNEQPPFHRLSLAPVEARLMGANSNIENCTFDLNPDLRTEQIPFEFDDLDKAITGLFQTHGSGVRCEIWFYYPNNDDPTLDILASMWFGTLKAPNIFGWKTLSTVATNGYRAREFTIPSSMRPRECRTKMFGGRAASAEVVRTLVCPYDRGVGGTVGLLNGAVPFIDCPKLALADCTTRFGHSRFFGGYNTDASATVTDARSGYIAVSKGNSSALKTPIRVVAGTKHLRGLQLLLWKREINANDPDRGFFAAVLEVSDGAVGGIRNIKVNEKLIEQIHLSVRNGERGQQAVANYNPGGTISNFSGVAHFNARYGWVNPLDITAATIHGECDVDGYREVKIFNSALPGNGLIGNYYSDTTWTTLLGTRIDHWIWFPSTVASPMEGLDASAFSVRWTGQIKPQYSETYTFEIEHDDGVKLWVNNTVVIDQLGTVGTHTGTIALTAETLYDIRIDFLQGPAPGVHPWYCMLRWSSASQVEQTVPHARLFHPGSPGSFVRQWTNDRVWWLLECYTSNRFGMAYPDSRFWTEDFKTASVWGLQEVQFQHTYPDGEVRTFSGRRTTFDAALEGRAAADQIEDICRSGALSVPFQYEGKHAIIPFRPFTAGELTAAPIFTDTGESRNIIWADGQPSIHLSKIPDEILTNEIILTFEEADNFDTERPITVDDPDQKLKAGRALGEDSLQAVPKRLAAFGIRHLQEAVRLGYRLLRFGEFDQGGTHNNLTAVFNSPLEQCLGLKRYQAIKIESALLDGHNYEAVQFTYFRLLRHRKIGNGLVEITAQAYNQTAYEAFETVTNSAPPPPGLWLGTDPDPIGTPGTLTASSLAYNASTGHLEVTLS